MSLLTCGRSCMIRCSASVCSAGVDISEEGRGKKMNQVQSLHSLLKDSSNGSNLLILVWISISTENSTYSLLC